MYYLLEDNRIVNSENIRKDLNLPFEVDFYIQKDEIVLTVDHIHFEHINITKKAENVFDLIEVGDLIASYRYSIEGRTEEKEINAVDELYTEENGVGINQCCIVDFEDICAIYKPDSEGNYIKVWEKKDKDENNT